MSGRIVEYKMLVSCLKIELALMVNEMLANGWKLYGTPFANERQFCQAMVKEVYKEGKR